MKRHRVAVIGGSISGCASAIALTRAGCEVTVYEQISGLGERGFSIGTPGPLRDDLIRRGYLPESYPTLQLAGRWWLLADGTSEGRTLWEQQVRAVTNNWGLLWSHLRESAAVAEFAEGARVESFTTTESGVELTTTDGATRSYDALVGADGYRSSVRAEMHPGAAPEYAGYVVWRSSYPESRVADRTLVDRMTAEQAFPTVVFPGGLGSVHILPGSDGSVEPGQRRINWAIYARVGFPADFSEPNSIPPGAVSAEQYADLDAILEHHFPPIVAALIRNSPREETAIQPIYDLTIPGYADGRTLLIGDAGALTRPHTSSGATKAIQDALVLEDLAAEHEDWAGLASAYDAERTPASNAIVEVGRRLGQAQVLDQPDWETMSAEDFPRWFDSILGEQKLYLFSDAKRD